MSSLAPQILEKIQHFARFPQTGVSLRQMVLFGQKPSKGTLFKASQFLHEELPIRLAHRVKEMDELPNGLNKMPSVLKVKDWYTESFQQLLDLPTPKLNESLRERIKEVARNKDGFILPPNVHNPSTKLPKNSSIHPQVPIDHRYYTNIDEVDCSPEMVDYTASFVKTIECIKRRHDPVVTTMARGIMEYKEHTNCNLIGTEVQDFLDRFYMSRIGIRMLIGQHSALYHGRFRQKNYVGVICLKSNIREIAADAIANARFVCEDYYGMFKAPAIQMICPGDIEFTYVPSHLNHILFELLKNSLRAVVERYGEDYEDEYPPIKLIIAHGKEDITIKISDEGGGISRSAIPLVWTYMYTTAQAQSIKPEEDDAEFKAPMAGFGYGLPISRLYVQYFGGDLKLVSMEGYGTDVYLHLNRLSNSQEPLP
ncbi:mitochondrial pyruvate dehydrogenase [Phycomyces nitens]|nr:mitochondrial pyruvate dehydrogenase [Phycomyces nitens]